MNGTSANAKLALAANQALDILHAVGLFLTLNRSKNEDDTIFHLDPTTGWGSRLQGELDMVQLGPISEDEYVLEGNTTLSQLADDEPDVDDDAKSSV